MFFLLPLITLFCICSCYKGKDINDDVNGLIGIPYAKAPLRDRRFTESHHIPFDSSNDYSQWKHSCGLDNGKSEDCLYLSIFSHKHPGDKVESLLILTNEFVNEKKLASLVSKNLNIIIAAVRDDLLGNYGGNWGESDIRSIIQFLKQNDKEFRIGKITVWAEGSIAESAAEAIQQSDVTRVILINGNTATRTYERDKYQSRLMYLLKKETQCDLPSSSQSIDCIRSLSSLKLLHASQTVQESFSPYGNPFRPESKDHFPQKQIPTILGVHKNLGNDYLNENNFNEKYDYKDFKKFLAGAIPDSIHKNGPLLRRLILHSYIYSKGDKKDTYFLFNQMNSILLHRDFLAPIARLSQHLADNKNKVYLFESGVDSSTISCLNGDSESTPFCQRIFAYFTRFATLGEPTEMSCKKDNPTFPALRSSKREYYIFIEADGQPVWLFDFKRETSELWNNLLPSFDLLQLAGRRDSVFIEETEVDPLHVEDDIQEWHEKAQSDETLLTEEKALNDMPIHFEL